MATYYISPTGNDTTGDGTQGNPWQTIAKAHLACAVSGDTIYCLDGTYTWVQMAFTRSITITGSNPASVVFDAGSPTAQVMWGTSIPLMISNITFRNNSAANNGHEGIFGFNTSVAHAASFNFTNCVFHDLYAWFGTGSWGGGIFGHESNGLNYSVGDYVFTGCLAYRLYSVAGAPGPVFGYNVGAGAEATIALRNCTFYLDAGGANALLTFALLQTPSEQSWVATNCIIQSTVSLSLGTAPALVQYSCIYGFTTSPTGTGVIHVDPLFVDPANANFNLRPTSPCIDTGVLV